MIRPKLLQVYLAGLMILAAGTSHANMDSAAAAISPQAAAAKIATVRVPFIENKGQIAGKEVQFYA